MEKNSKMSKFKIVKIVIRVRVAKDHSPFLLFVAPLAAGVGGMIDYWMVIS